MSLDWMSHDLLWVVLGLVAFVLLFFFVFRILTREKLPPPSAPSAEAQLPVEKPAAPEVLAPTEPEKPLAPVTPIPKPRSWYERLRSGLTRTQAQLVRSIDEFMLSKDVKLTREQTLERLFEILIRADLGVKTSEKLLNTVKEKLRADDAGSPEAIKQILRDEILEILSSAQNPVAGTIEETKNQPHVVLMVGVNGVGKTTTTGKLAFKAHQHGLEVVIGAADTFRAAAIEQLAVWADRSKASLVRLKDGADPASVAFETVKTAKQKNAQLCIVDTAGRLHNRNDLMQELAKIRRIVGKEIESAPHEVLLVLDATTGQNAIQQAKVFREIVNITGLVLTKLDGTAKGGVAVAIVDELKVPIRYIGVGESVEDLEVFKASEFVEALFAQG